MKDTLTPELNLSIDAGVHSGQISARYMPSSIPQQTGRTNYVDNDQIATDIGYARTFPSDDFDLKVGVGCQVYLLIDRQHWKNKSASAPIIDELPDSVSIRTGEPINGAEGLQTNNPGFPGFSSGGYGILWGVSVGVYR